MIAASISSCPRTLKPTDAMHRTLVIALFLAAVGLPLSQAQLRGPAITIPGPPTGVRFGRAGVGHFPGPGLLLGSPYVYADYPAVPASEPPVIFVQMPSPSEPAPAEPKSEPLLIEWRGDRYVRLSGASADGTPGPGTAVPLDYREPEAVKSTAGRAASAEPAPPELTPVVLVYRDGHREQIREYSIANGMIYARGDYWSDGYWSKKIQLTALDLPATAKASQELGSRFVLPASPNEVILQP
jgi:hypothetical protein